MLHGWALSSPEDWRFGDLGGLEELANRMASLEAAVFAQKCVGSTHLEQIGAHWLDSLRQPTDNLRPSRFGAGRS